MTEADPSASVLENWSDWIVYILRSRGLDGAEGLYFRVADAAAKITRAKHAVVVLPSGPEMLRVAGCSGLPTTVLETFSISRGIIGREFRHIFDGKKYLIVNDVSQDPDYHPFDESVQSELLVPVFDADRKAILAIINVEARRKDHFGLTQAEMVFSIGEVMVEHQEHLVEMNRIQKRNECFHKILESIPDELMVIDKNFHPIYANKTKRQMLPNLAEYLERHGGRLLEQFCACTSSSETGSDATCHSLIEMQGGVCGGCVCDRAMKLDRVIQGVVYKPHIPNPVVELSAAPLRVGHDKIVGCVEIARNVNQREAVLGLAPDLFRVYDQDQLLRGVTNLLNAELGYDRVRLYSLEYDSDSGQHLLEGVTYSGRHHQLEGRDFSHVKIYVPDKLEPILIKSEKASRLDLEGSEEPDECYGYWRVGLSRDEARDFIDPRGCLELENVWELASVPIYTSRHRWIAFLDSKYHRKRRFTSDDLQALTAFSRTASTALEWVHENKMRFRFAALGETTLGLRHTVASFLRPEQLQAQIIAPLQEAIQLAREYVRSRPAKEHGEVMASILGLIADSAVGTKAVPPKGRYLNWVE